ncbi:MAG: tetraacyldisaccharide 4'-kinase [Synergistaceae bacterium]|nr:tetraacyldisaccharide 4'-kinase [Synergistaceae bacterium]
MSFVRGTGKSVREGKRFFSLWLPIVPASWLAAAWIGLVDFLFRHGLERIQTPSIPVISVGNISYGGTNKTPFVETLCRKMREKGVAVGIVSRGYGGANASVLVFEEGLSDRRIVGDEPLLLSARLPDVPLAVSRERLQGVRELERRGIELVIADDAFQHRRMGRDVDIVLVDAACPFGNGLLIPAGILRERPEKLSRAHIVVLTKVEEVSPEALAALRMKISEYVPSDHIFSARLVVTEWVTWDGQRFLPCAAPSEGRGVAAFSAIGSPDSFVFSLKQEGVKVRAERHFRDHHRYTAADMEELVRLARQRGAEFLSCTEKDVYNLPCSWKPPIPLVVPRVATLPEEPERFYDALFDCLRPRLVVASNGYGEDAIGVLAAKKLRDAFPGAEILAFPLVGTGEPYKAAGFAVESTPSVTPSGGVLKYRLRDLWGDIRAGLPGHIRKQQRDWSKISRVVHTPLCVGDVYLLLHTLWGQGRAPLFVATAKTVHLSGHWRLERLIIRHCTLRTWTRDRGTADQLAAFGADAVYAGNPIMDLLDPVPDLSPGAFGPSPRVMLLPGSRPRAYEDVKLLLDAVEELQSRISCEYVMVLAPTIDVSRLLQSCEGWETVEEAGERSLSKNGTRIRLHQGGVSTAASGVSLLMGLGGTANQLCAGMGIPVLSIDEKGKRVQKKLLGDAEILVEPLPDALAAQAFAILSDPALHKKMSDAGRSRMGEPGALDDVVRYAAETLGWKKRCALYDRLSSNNRILSSEK